jgi:hypothetical protein
MSNHLIFNRNVPSWWRNVVIREPEPVLRHGREWGNIGLQGVTPQAFHHITVTGTTEFHDYETFGSDEHGTFGFRQETTLSTNDLGSTLLTWRKGFGGEERIELDIDGSLRPDGVLAVNIQIRFYEGATEGTTELEDSKVFQAIVPEGQTSNFTLHLRNDEDDWATTRASIGNRKI